MNVIIPIYVDTVTLVSFYFIYFLFFSTLSTIKFSSSIFTMLIDAGKTRIEKGIMKTKQMVFLWSIAVVFVLVIILFVSSWFKVWFDQCGVFILSTTLDIICVSLIFPSVCIVLEHWGIQIGNNCLGNHEKEND
jgi:hypothetical protein